MALNELTQCSCARLSHHGLGTMRSSVSSDDFLRISQCFFRTMDASIVLL